MVNDRWMDCNQIGFIVDCDTAAVGLVSGDDGSTFREEGEMLSAWCTTNNLILNTSKTEELIVDFRRNKSGI